MNLGITECLRYLGRHAAAATPAVLFALAWAGVPPAAAAQEAAASAPEGATRYYDRNGILLRTLPAEGSSIRYPARLDDVSPAALLATLAAEDRRFFSHAGVDLLAVARALLQNAAAGRRVSGASTITQQLARFRRSSARGPGSSRPGTGRRTWRAKLAEALAAVRLEAALDKRAILEEYLNSIPYGNRAAGIEAAARVYLDKPASDLTLAEAAYLAAIPKAPSVYDPWRSHASVLARQREVLRRLLAWGWVDRETWNLAAAERVRPVPRERAFAAPHFIEALRRQAGARASFAAPGRAPAGVRTSLDLRLQEAAERALRSHLAGMRRNRAGSGAVLALDNSDGRVLAWVGSRDFFDEAASGQVDGVLGRRQPGSAGKPFLYGLAFSRGWRTPDLLEDAPLMAADRFTPRNYDQKFHGLVRLREALACSYNVPAVRLVEAVGVDSLLETLRRAGMASLDKPASHYGAALALGTGEVSLLELTRAYAMLARGGVWLPERRTMDKGPGPGAARRVFSREAAYLVTSVLSDDSAREPAFGPDSALRMPFPMAAKTGTSKDYRDNWAVGYTPDWTVGVWVGNPDGTPMIRVSGVAGAGPILRDVALAARDLLGSRPFEVPPGIRTAEVCPVSGALPGPGCPGTMLEVFMKDRMPARACRLHRLEAGRVVEARTLPGEKVSVAFPQDDDIFKLDPRRPPSSQAVRLKARGAADGEQLRWLVDGRPLPAAGPDGAWWEPSPGRHRVAVSALRGGTWTASRPVSVLVLAP